jgi:hypothetical protein
VSYTYNTHMLEPYFLLSHYGFAIPNNPFANLGLTLRHVRAELATPQLQVCETIKCADITTDYSALDIQLAQKLETWSLSRGLLNFLFVKSMGDVPAEDPLELYFSNFHDLRTHLQIVNDYLGMMFETRASASEALEYDQQRLSEIVRERDQIEKQLESTT